jgi:hypothetical protein
MADSMQDQSDAVAQAKNIGHEIGPQIYLNDS